MIQIQLSIGILKEKRIIILRFPNIENLKRIVRSFREGRWNITHKAWTIPYSIHSIAEIKNAFAAIPEVNIDATEIRKSEKSDIG